MARLLAEHIQCQEEEIFDIFKDKLLEIVEKSSIFTKVERRKIMMMNYNIICDDNKNTIKSSI